MGKRLLTAKDIKEYLAISQTAAYELMRRTDFPTISFGRQRRVKEDDLEAWLEAHKNPNTPRGEDGKS